MLVLSKRGDDDFVEQAGNAQMLARVRLARMAARRVASVFARGDRDGMRTLALISSGLGRAIALRRADLIHWHWVGAEIISLSEMALPRIPAVWTCHDQWAFCGAEHYASDRRFMDGYQSKRLFDVDAMTFRRKQREWAGWHPTLICPSEWMAQTARASVLMGGEDIVSIPNTIDARIFAPQPRALAHKKFGLPQDDRIVLFGADSGVADPRKGFDLLMAALGRVAPEKRSGMLLATFGGEARTEDMMAGFRHIELGHLSASADLAALYSAADVFVAPSRQDNLPNTLVEAQMCGLPSVAFAIGGMGDMIARPEHGALVSPFDVDALAIAVQHVSAMPRDCTAIHRDAVTRFGAKTVVEQHAALYARLLRGPGQGK